MLSRDHTLTDHRVGYASLPGLLNSLPVIQPKPLAFRAPGLADVDQHLSMSDCLSLVNAISQRVYGSVDECSSEGRRQLAQECQTALLQLKEAMLLSHARRWQLEVDVVDARAEWAGLRAELAQVAANGAPRAVNAAADVLPVPWIP